MKLILKLFQKHGISILTPNDFHPSDKMALDPVKRLFEKITDMLLSIICDIRANESIDPNQRNQLEEQIVKIENIIKYLTNLGIIYRISTASVLEDMKQSLEQFELDGNVIPESVKLVSKYREEEVRVFERIIEIIEPDEYEESEDSSFPFTDSMSADERRRVITLTFYLKRILSIRELSCFGEQARFKASGRTALQVCIFDGCQAMFANSTSYDSHVTQPHRILSKEDAQKYKQVLEDQEKFKNKFNGVFRKFEIQPDQSKCNIFILDSETTGLTSNAEIIELSCACLNGEAFYRKSNPTISRVYQNQQSHKP
ncbi:hypothetical protein DICPUDRAFT_78474 [Dictyostelium purpureum]|uniref:Uncharacterized protein n=1 Tax=Dictyostelium purpureum TaxID=5786 RepID=F0ZJN7_DICPU|nr:uncharacterized protein DICPUDRAFT_78474 [Dictyostelium purpureum]EGC35847.1 hypothetical protein DICPUDRAFT_78474 [Dictyostelium purpureum]|eukprot:XP_003287636.1 hypothetical protein DICPUDRAFT_78474 [Dictyostelium purpureum]